MTLRELGPGDTALAYAALRELRPHLEEAEGFVDQVDRRQRPAGYRLVGAFEEGAEAVAAMGFRYDVCLSWGDHLYIADLVTLPAARRRGHARALLAWAAAEAERLGCAQVHLDSGTVRHGAHRLYLGQGYDITAFHFARAVGAG